MQLDFLFSPRQPAEDCLQLSAGTVPVRFVRNDAARRYILRLGSDGSARVTVPRRGSIKAAREFAQRQVAWIEKQLHKRTTQSAQPAAWVHGTEILFRGEMSTLLVDLDGKRVRFADQSIALRENLGDLRPAIEEHLRTLAVRELFARTWELASLHGVAISRVSVRNQRSRWGSCSARKTISLNWRLVQTPVFVTDYIILHELMHLREMNHSRRFWRQVEQVCPDFQKAESWLKAHSGLLTH